MARTPGPVERHVADAFMTALEGNPAMLAAKYEERSLLTREETDDVIFSLLGALRGIVVQLAREIDDVHTRLAEIEGKDG